MWDGSERERLKQKGQCTVHSAPHDAFPTVVSHQLTAEGPRQQQEEAIGCGSKNHYQTKSSTLTQARRRMPHGACSHEGWGQTAMMNRPSSAGHQPVVCSFDAVLGTVSLIPQASVNQASIHYKSRRKTPTRPPTHPPPPAEEVLDPVQDAVLRWTPSWGAP